MSKLSKTNSEHVTCYVEMTRILKLCCIHNLIFSLSENPFVQKLQSNVLPLNPPFELTHTPNWVIHTQLLGVWFCKIGCCPLSPCWLSTLLIKRRSLGKSCFALLIDLSASRELLIVPHTRSAWGLPTQRRIVYFSIFDQLQLNA